MAFRTAKYIKHKTGKLPVKEGKLFYEFNGQQLWEGDARNLHFIPDESVQLIVTSPPYNVAMDYGDWHDALSIDDYLEFTEQWLKEAYRVLCVGGRLAVNVPACLTQSTGSKIAFVAMDIWNIATKKIGFLPRDWICWCLGSDTPIVAQIENKYWFGTIAELYKIWKLGKEIFLPTLLNRPTIKVVWRKIQSIDEIWDSGLELETTTGIKINCTEEHLFPIFKTTGKDKRQFLCIQRMVHAKELLNFKNKNLLYYLGGKVLNIPQGSEDDYIKGLAICFFLAEGNKIKRKAKSDIELNNSAVRWAKVKDMIPAEYVKKRKSGELTWTTAICFSCGIKDLPILKKISKMFKMRIIKQNKTLTAVSHDKSLISLIETYTDGEVAKNKSLLPDCLNTSYKFLKGIFDGFLHHGDGYYDSKNKRWIVGICDNYKLTMGIMVLNFILGEGNLFRGPYLYKAKGFKKLFPALKFYIVNKDESNVYYALIKKVISSNMICPYYNITLEDVKYKNWDRKKIEKFSGLFLLGNGILTHNSKPYLLQGITSWGSWLSQSSPFCRDKTEYIIVFSKKDYKLDPRGKQSDLTKDEFLRLSKNLWTMAPENRKLHPAPFPLELPLRVIKFYCFPEDIVLDPFVGSGTTLLACKLLNRKGIGVDYNPNYLKIAKERIAQQTLPLKDVILTKFKFIEDEDYFDKLEYTQLELFNKELDFSLKNDKNDKNKNGSVK